MKKEKITKLQEITELTETAGMSTYWAVDAVENALKEFKEGNIDDGMEYLSTAVYYAKNDFTRLMHRAAIIYNRPDHLVQGFDCGDVEQFASKATGNTEAAMLAETQ